MISTMPAPYREPDDRTLKWIIIFILLSLLAHVIFIGALLIITRLLPAPKLHVPPPENSKITLSLLPPPAAPKPVFVPTHPQQNTPHKPQKIESANDTVLQSRSKTARKSDSIMPDITGKEKAPDLNNSPQVKAPKTPEVASTPPTPREAQPQKPTPPTPHPQMTQVQPRPLPPQPKPAPPRPPQPQEPAIDPVTGLPVLPPINAPTMAPPDQTRSLAPAASQQQVAGSVHGALGRAGDNSPAAMATELGKYKQYVYNVVGSYWYPAVDQKFGTIGVGIVHIQFTINKDGTLTDVRVLDGDNQTILRDISLEALRQPAPFKPFSDAMIQQVGNSYTDDFSFSVY